MNIPIEKTADNFLLGLFAGFGWAFANFLIGFLPAVHH